MFFGDSALSRHVISEPENIILRNLFRKIQESGFCDLASAFDESPDSRTATQTKSDDIGRTMSKAHRDNPVEKNG
jgi:hypothetical protein